MTTAVERAGELFAESQQPHEGVFIVGPETLELRTDELPAAVYEDGSFLTASLGNCRCTSDAKAIKQFTAHARVPSNAAQIALGHEALQMVLQAPADSGLKAGDLVVLTPGHSSAPVDPQSFELDDDGVLAALGYSYRYLGGLRRFNATPPLARKVVAEHGFGELFNVVPPNQTASVASLAHAEPFACNYGTNKHIFFEQADGGFAYGVPAKANIAYLGGTARMAMINLTIVASVPDDELPSVVSITGSQRKLDELTDFALIQDLRAKGVTIELIDRNADDIVERLTAHGKPQVIWTNFAATSVYEQAVQAIAPGGNINSYAGASDPELVLDMAIAPAASFADAAAEAAAQIQAMHHNVSPNDPNRSRGLAAEPAVRLIGFADSARAQAYVDALPAGSQIAAADIDGLTVPAGVTAVDSAAWTDVFIASTGADAAAAYSEVELELARSAAVNFVTGDTTIAIRSRHTHYTSRHQICGSNIPWTMTNTSEPVAEDLARQATDPVDFDWMVAGVCGLRAAVGMMDTVGAAQPFGSFFVYNDLPDLPYVPCTAADFRAAAAEADGNVAAALTAGADALETSGDRWCRAVEEAVYAAYGVPFPLALG